MKSLDFLQYDPELEKWYFSFFLRFRVLFLIIFALVIAGGISLRALPLESEPEVQIGIGVVSVVLPSASPEIVEDLVTKKLEKQIAKMKGIDTLSSTSKEGVAIVTVQFQSNVVIAQAMMDLKDKVDAAKKDLPTEAKEPVVTEVALDKSPVWTFSLGGNYNGFDLYDYADTLREALEGLSSVSEVTITGGDQKEFVVTYRPEVLQQYGLSAANINQLIQSSNITLPLGDFVLGTQRMKLTMDTRFFSIGDLQKFVVVRLSDGTNLTLADVANISVEPKKRETLSRLASRNADGTLGESVPAVTLGVVKKRGGSIVDLIADGKKVIVDLQASGQLPADLQIITTLDKSERILLDAHHLTRDSLITVVLVFLVLFLIIGVREALVAGIAAPLVFLTTFIVMNIAGQTLNFLSMFALILALGLLVDDAIVVISAMNQYMSTGKFTMKQAAFLVLRDYKIVLISTTLTVVWVFSAMLFMTGIIGKYLFSLPFIITVTLLASLLIALSLNPALAVFFHRNESHTAAKKWWQKPIVSLHAVELFYARVLRAVLQTKRRSVTVILITIALFVSAVGLPASGIVRSEFFPKTDQDMLALDVELPAGSSLTETQKILTTLEQSLRKEKDVLSLTVNVGAGAALGGRDGASQAHHLGNIVLDLVKKEYRVGETSIEIAERLRHEFASVQGAKVKVVELAGGPPAGADFEMKIAGDNFADLDVVAADFVQVLRTIPWVVDPESSRKSMPVEFRLVYNQDALMRYSLTPVQITMMVRNMLDGAEVTKVFRGADEIQIRTLWPKDDMTTPQKLLDTQLLTPRGQMVFLRDIATLDMKPASADITRLDQKRIVKVSARAAKGVSGTQILAEFQKKTASYKLPAGVEILLGGANEENAKSVRSLLIALAFGMLCIIGTLVLLFDSYRQSVLVLVTIPFSLIGVFYGLAVFDQPLSFPGLIGLVALFGIVVRNGIILFDKVNQNRSFGLDLTESLVDAGMTRLEPVLLTSVCTILGMIPLTVSNPTWTSLGLSIIFGLFASTFLTLLVLPVLYHVFLKKTHTEQRV